MLSPEEIILRLEEAARTDGPRVFVSGKLRVDCEWVHDMAQHYYRVNGVGALRQQVIRAINEARLSQTITA
jgi:hypothetical protein